MSSRDSAAPQYIQHKQDFAKETFYSLLSDASTDCNTMCGAGNQTCFKNCVVKNKALIDVMRDYILYSKVKETTALDQQH